VDLTPAGSNNGTKAYKLSHRDVMLIKQKNGLRKQKKTNCCFLSPACTYAFRDDGAIPWQWNKSYIT
jgi:hypothetical protein